ncbi:MAG: chromosome segregation protein SMC [Proteobacteria bacterium]|nr:MAG: chromosome segregation protein SMC [Pseudomonadota bacterium]
MRLSKIKLAGFKSFVDPTTFEMRSNLTAIVGPNGCGKSNTIDAVRWVMGESSAKHLRGTSMEDVIFNGSATRKKVGQASIELVFDNSDGSLGGEYAQYSEISTKRQISRDGQSKYFLNGSRCRRRDITDIFLGTGLGPRSYAIIEQGMISRLIDAKPEELRVYIEEAAGISKYKERRRETENRIRSTRDNLDRLGDLQEEIDKQLGTLKRQAKAAERFRDYKTTERRLSAELLYLQLQSVEKELHHQQAAINEQAALHQTQLSQQRSIESQLEALRNQQTEANTHFNQVQASVYEAGANVSRFEQQIRHQHEMVERNQQQRAQLAQELANARTHLQHDELRLSDALSALELLAPQAEEMLEIKVAQEEALDTAEQALNHWKQEWAQLQQQIAEPNRQVSVESSRIQQLEQQISRNQQRLARLEQQQNEQHGDADAAESIAEAQEQQSILAEQIQEIALTLEATQGQSAEQQSFIRERQQSLDTLRSTIQTTQGRLSSLETLQQAGLGKDKEQLKQWLKAQNLHDLPRLTEQIQVTQEWENALEALLGPTLEALQITDQSQAEAIIAAGCEQSLELFLDAQNIPLTDLPADSLAHHIQQPIGLKALVTNVFCVTDRKAALARQASLKPGEKLITPDGSCYATNWIHLSGQSSSDEGGVLARQTEIDALQQQLEDDQALLEKTEHQLQASQTQYDALNTEQQNLQQQQQALQRKESEANARLRALEQQQEQQAQFSARLSEEISDLAAQQEQDSEDLLAAQEAKAVAEAQIEQLSDDIEQLKDKQHGLEQMVSHCRQSLQSSRDQYQALQIQLETQRSAKLNSEQQLTRITLQIEQLQARELSQKDAQLDEVLIAELQQQLDVTLEQRRTAEIALKDARESLSNIDTTIRQQELARSEAESKVIKLREHIEALKLNWQSVNVRHETLTEQLAETEFNPEDLQLETDLASQIQSCQEELQAIKLKIQNLGAINLAAIDEYESQNERKTHLDAQHADLSEALATLESAIRKIDKDTRGRFKDTFEQVNARIQEMFPRLFGGGQAYLEMTGDDLLTTGILIMARPPGKRISSIQLMSGGEKALTAAAMVFAIFELNPAPFCMLDEVDAPLDEANVGRFCELVKHMSERLQFIFITHNKTTMELAENLIGVTMREPGVSRMVAVDVDEAAKMIQS